MRHYSSYGWKHGSSSNMPTQCKVLNSNPDIAKRKKSERKRERERERECE
jgi:hypothetical protein